jgi:hypothetical protein
VDKVKAFMTTGKFHDRFSGVANRYADFRPHYPAGVVRLAVVVAVGWK